MEVLISLIISLIILGWLILTGLRILIYIIKLPFRLFRRNKDRSYGEMREVFSKSRKHKLHSKILKSNSPGLSGLWHQLLIRVNFDVPTAERLISNLKWKHPGKSDRWLIEKAIYDLERDRRKF
jgi:hypothetical protein